MKNVNIILTLSQIWQMNSKLKYIIDNFSTEGVDFIVGNRNIIKNFPYEDKIISVKSFKKPKLITAFIYRYFRKSKARRSFEYASHLQNNNIGTPTPIAYFENKNLMGLLDSYYICEYLKVDYVFKDLFLLKDEELLEKILKGFAAFSFKLHENGIEFLDHSPGNTLIKKNDDETFSYYLVDLNRMKFHKQMSFETRMKNLSRITPSEHMVKIISHAYAKLYNKPENEVFFEMWKQTQSFFKKFDKKRKIKKMFKLK